MTLILGTHIRIHRGQGWAPEGLKIGTRGVRAKIWAFLLVNERRWFTAKEISGYLEIPLSIAQVALKDLLRIAASVWSLDKEREGKGRPGKRYSFQRFIPSTE